VARGPAARRTPRQPLNEVDAVLMRKDPPFDSEYFYATHLLEQAEREGARVFNSRARCATTRRSWRSWSSRSYIAPTLVTRARPTIRAFHAEHRDIILKPLDGMGGMGIFRVGPTG
jgi:glutathione synthase